MISRHCFYLLKMCTQSVHVTTHYLRSTCLTADKLQVNVFSVFVPHDQIPLSLFFLTNETCLPFGGQTPIFPSKIPRPLQETTTLNINVRIGMSFVDEDQPYFSTLVISLRLRFLFGRFKGQFRKTLVFYRLLFYFGLTYFYILVCSGKILFQVSTKIGTSFSLSSFCLETEIFGIPIQWV